VHIYGAYSVAKANLVIKRFVNLAAV